MTNEDLFAVRAKTKRGRIVYFLANFDSLISHKHLETVQYLDDTTKTWIEFSDIKVGTQLAKNVDNLVNPLTSLGNSNGNVYYGFKVKFEVYDKHNNCIYSKYSVGRPTEYYAYMKQSIIDKNNVKLKDLTYKAKIIDTEDWYQSRQKNEKRKGEGSKQFTIIHI